MKKYYALGGFRGEQGQVRVMRDVPFSSQSYPLEHHIRHSPDGHAWGYGGSGPAELAKDILWDFLGYEPPMDMYQAFKFQVISRIDQNQGFSISENEVGGWVNVYKSGNPNS